jgi:hypothetical protein
VSESLTAGDGTDDPPVLSSSFTLSLHPVVAARAAIINVDSAALRTVMA